MSDPVQPDIKEDSLLTQINQLVTEYNARQLDQFNFPMRLIVDHHNYVCKCRQCYIESSQVDEYRAGRLEKVK